MIGPHTIRDAVNADVRLLHRGRYVDAVVLLGVGDALWRLDIRRGRVEAADTGPFVMPSSTFRLSAPEGEWRAFWEPVPAPGHHDIFAMLKRRVLAAEGDLHPLMANLFYFKALLASPRGTA